MNDPKPAGSPSAPRLLVVNQGEATVSIVDPVLAKSIATLPGSMSGMKGHEITASADGRFAYLPLYGDSGIGRPGADGDSLLVLDLEKLEIRCRVPLQGGVRPHDIVLDNAKQVLYLTTELAQSVTVMDSLTMAIIGSIPTGSEQSHMMALSKSGRVGYTANVSTGTVSVLDLENRTLLTKIAVSGSVQRVSVSPDDQTIVTADQENPRLAFLDAATCSVRSFGPLPSFGYGSAFTQDGKWLLVTLPHTGQIAVIDFAGNRIEHLLDVGARPQQVLIQPEERFAYVSCFGARHVAVVDLATWRVVSRIDTGDKADGMAWVN